MRSYKLTQAKTLLMKCCINSNLSKLGSSFSDTQYIYNLISIIQIKSLKIMYFFNYFLIKITFLKLEIGFFVLLGTIRTYVMSIVIVLCIS